MPLAVDPRYGGRDSPQAFSFLSFRMCADHLVFQEAVESMIDWERSQKVTLPRPLYPAAMPWRTVYRSA